MSQKRLFSWGIACLVCGLFIEPTQAALIFNIKANTGVTTTGALVDSITDQSGAGNSVTGSTTTRPSLVTNSINGLPAIRFNDAHKLIGSSTTAFDFGTGDFTIAAVVNLGTQVGAGTRILGNLTNTSPFTGVMLDAGLSAGKVSGAFRPTGTQTTINSTTNFSTSQIEVYLLERVGTSISLFRNGVSVATGTLPGGSSFNGDGITLGAERTGGGEYLTGDIFEVQIYNNSFNSTDRTNLMNGLMMTYAVVPEPTTWVFAACSTIGLLAIRRRKTA